MDGKINFPGEPILKTNYGKVKKKQGKVEPPSNQLSSFDPDPKFPADGNTQRVRFLRDRGYISGK